MPGTKLRDKTLELLRNRPSTVTLKDVAKGSQLTEGWIRSFHLGSREHYSVVFIEILYEYLAKTKLKV